MVVTLSDQQLQQLADFVADRLRSAADGQAEPVARHLVDAKTLAAKLGVSRQTVYARAEALGGERIGQPVKGEGKHGKNGRKPPWRFDLEVARAAMSCSTSRQSGSENTSAGAASGATTRRTRRRLPNRLPEPGSILQPRPRKVVAR